MAAQLRIRVGVCVTNADRILLVEHEKASRRYWLVPGGGVEIGETLRETAARETLEETGYSVDVGPLQIVCEAIDPGGRHIVNLVYAATLTGGELQVGKEDGALRDAVWQPRDELARLTMYPPIGLALLTRWEVGFGGPPLELGNVWR
ncbi:MAG: NUDIX hydrolase [Candidatus Dormibacteraeota bacterium]|nr:NUDIX hydrolase [Candidatus Dormibacteraeota bacterium]